MSILTERPRKFTGRHNLYQAQVEITIISGFAGISLLLIRGLIGLLLIWRHLDIITGGVRGVPNGLPLYITSTEEKKHEI